MPLIVAIIVGVVVMYCCCARYHNKKMIALAMAYSRNRQTERDNTDENSLAPPPYSSADRGKSGDTELPSYSISDPYTLPPPQPPGQGDAPAELPITAEVPTSVAVAEDVPLLEEEQS